MPPLTPPRKTNPWQIIREIGVRKLVDRTPFYNHIRKDTTTMELVATHNFIGKASGLLLQNRQFNKKEKHCI